MKSQFTIRQVIDLTGVSEYTIRGWENRYQAIKPNRTEKGRRLYTSNDILKIKALKDLVDRGYQISTIANLSYEDLQELLTESQFPILTQYQNPDVLLLLEYAEKFSWNKVKEVIFQQKNKLKDKDFIFDFIIPLLREINALVDNKQFSIAQEHILSAMIKEELFSLRSSLPPKNTKARYVFATPEMELHELGILISSTLANLCGKPNLYLGPNTPREQVVDVCLRYEATHLVISATYSPNKDQLLSFLHFIDKQLPKNTRLCLGGHETKNLMIKFKREMIIFETFEEIYNYFQTN